MIPSELMIKDWVLVNERDEYTPAPHNVPYPVLLQSGKDIDMANEVTYSPVPLTPEILEKNGWEIVADCYARLELTDNKSLDYNFHHLYFREWLKHISKWNNRDVSIEAIFHCYCTHVHELQHALRLCGLTELADNFKI